ncbi:MAG: hypothetical protein ABL919_04730 [Methylococcales bacterium]|nr:hypothetical protein [Methylococcaceae bacterium]
MLLLDTKYSHAQLDRIRDQGAIFMCACPSQVSLQITHLRKLFEYQRQCVRSDESYINSETHRLIAKATADAHKIMEDCMEEILIREAWNLETLEMPANLRELMLKVAEDD